jgi:hypothetical protein
MVGRWLLWFLVVTKSNRAADKHPLTVTFWLQQGLLAFEHGGGFVGTTG